MKVVIAPDTFKDSLSAKEVCEAIEQGMRSQLPDARFHQLPLGDGGEGTLDAIVAASEAQFRTATVLDPLGRPVTARFGWAGRTRTAIIEMAEASGLQRLEPEERNPDHASSYGTGELIRAALDMGAEQLVIGLGGSATNDAGAGLLMALGARLTDKRGHPLPPGGKALADLSHLDLSELDSRLAQVKIRVACDVTNPLCGPRGASAVFGPQKGASPLQVTQLDQSLKNFADCAYQETGVELHSMEGGGAAGGTGATLSGLLQGQLVSGIELVLDLLNFDQVIRDADWVITGEGRVDSQTLGGKTLAGVGLRARLAAVPVIALAGEVSGSTASLQETGITAVFSITSGPGTLAEALANCHENLVRTSTNLAAVIRTAST